MKLFTKPLLAQLLKNGKDFGKDHLPVVKLFTPDANATWLLTEIDPEEPDIAFGLCDLGMGFPELGNVSISEISAIRGRLRLPVERDTCFTAEFPISVYAEAARQKQRITTRKQELLDAQAILKSRKENQDAQ